MPYNTIEKQRAYSKTRRENNRKAIAAYNRKWYLANKEQENQRKRIQRADALAKGLCSRCCKRPQEHGIHCMFCIKRVRALDKGYSKRNKEEVVAAYGGKCACCGEARIEFLSIDHPNNDGAKHRRRGKKNMEDGIRKTGAGVHIYRFLRSHGFPEGYRLLCYNCNCSRGFFGYCPHERERINGSGDPARASKH